MSNFHVNIHAKSGAKESTAASSSGGSKCKYTLRTNDDQRAQYDAIKNTPRIPELDQPTNSFTFSEVPMQDVMYPIIEEHQVLIVAGSFFGDEGKGKTVDAIARHPDCNVVARTNSGENAGHTVLDAKGNKFIFHLAPSGLLLDNKKNLVGPECVMDPVSFMKTEIQPMIDAGLDYKSKLFLGNCHIVTPYHKLLDLICSAPNSSTLKGMSPIHASKVTKKGPRMDHLFNSDDVLRSRLTKDIDSFYSACLIRKMDMKDVLKRCHDENSDGVKRIPDHVMAFVEAEDKIQYLIDMYKKEVSQNPLFPARVDVSHEIRQTLASGKKVLLEGPQSYWLSNAREKFWESSTSADTSASGILATGQYNFQRYKTAVINVHKTPGTSRVGIGANPSSYVPQDYFSAQNIKTLRDIHPEMCTDFHTIQALYGANAVKANGIVEPIEFTDKTGTYNIGVAMSVAASRHHGETGATTLKPRVCGLFDCVAHFEVNSAQGPFLTISALDRGDDYDFVAMTIAYIFWKADGVSINCNGREYKNGDIIKAGDAYPTETALFHCYPIVKQVPGWKDSPIAADRGRKFGDPLPKGVCEFIATAEHFTGAKVISIGNGPAGPNIIYIKRSDEACGSV